MVNLEPSGVGGDGSCHVLLELQEHPDLPQECIPPGYLLSEGAGLDGGWCYPVGILVVPERGLPVSKEAEVNDEGCLPPLMDGRCIHNPGPGQQLLASVHIRAG